MHRPARVAALVAALTVLPATAALAHPSLNPNAIPAGEPVETTLVIPHGCSTGDEVMPEEGDAVPTTRFDLQLVDGVTIEPGEVDGWNVTDDGEAIVWTDAGGATTDPIELPITVTAQGEAGDEILLSAYQECADGQSYRWTEGAEGTPPVALELTAGETGTTEMDHGDDHGSEHDGGAMTDEPTDPVEQPTASASEDETEALADPASARASVFRPMPWLVGLALLAAAAVGAGVVWARRRGAA